MTHCTCPSGDGSLRWPCPTHPPTESEIHQYVWLTAYKSYTGNGGQLHPSSYAIEYADNILAAYKARFPVPATRPSR